MNKIPQLPTNPYDLLEAAIKHFSKVTLPPRLQPVKLHLNLAHQMQNTLTR